MPIELIMASDPGKKSRRLSSYQEIWDIVIGQYDRKCLPANKLPTNRVIMQRYQTLRLESAVPNKAEIRPFANTIANELMEIWGKANVSTKPRKACVEHIVRLISSWSTFLSNSHKSDPSGEKVQKFRTKMDELCDIAAADLEETMRSTNLPTWKRDFEFYLNNKSGKHDVMEGLDKNTASRVKRTQVRAVRKEKYAQKVMSKAESSLSSSTNESELDKLIGDNVDECEDNVAAALDPDVSLTEWRKRELNQKPETINIQLPRKGLAKALAPGAARMKLSSRQSFAVAADMIKVGNGKLADFNISRASVYRQRRDGEHEFGEKLLSKFMNNPNVKYLIIHWDGKIVQYDTGRKEDRIVILLQSIGVIPPQFIGSPKVPNGTGQAMYDVMMRYLDAHKVLERKDIKLVGMCFDTTASNTGVRQGSATRLDKQVSYSLLWFGCRHHAAERHMVWADEAVRGAPKPGGEDPLFKRFENHFDFIDLDDLKFWDGNTNGNNWFSQQANNVRVFAENLNVSESWIREDYQELNELLIAYFGGVVRRRGLDGTVYNHPWHMERAGAVSTARFMGRSLYFIKIEMTKHQLPETVISTEEKTEVGRVAKFTLFLYAKYFLQTMVPAAAPRLDLEFWRETHQFQTCDPHLVDFVLTSVYRHMWYLSEELVPLALCDDGTSSIDKENIVKAMLASNRPQSYKPQKPVMKSQLLHGRNPDQPALADFVGPRSWLIIDILDVKYEWMQYPATRWGEFDDYVRYRDLVKCLKVVNDCAERAVKDMQEYLGYCQDAEHREKVVTVANHHRQLVNFKTMRKDDIDAADYSI